MIGNFESRSSRRLLRRSGGRFRRPSLSLSSFFIVKISISEGNAFLVRRPEPGTDRKLLGCRPRRRRPRSRCGRNFPSPPAAHPRIFPPKFANIFERKASLPSGKIWLTFCRRECKHSATFEFVADKTSAYFCTKISSNVFQ